MEHALDQFIDAMPKVELHLHLEGSIQPATLLRLADRHGLPLATMSPAELNDLFVFHDFAHFIETYIMVCECLRTPDDFALVVTDLGAEAARQQTRYLEVHFNPEPHVRRRGLRFDEIMGGINRGRDEVRDRWGIELRWIALPA